MAAHEKTAGAWITTGKELKLLKATLLKDTPARRQYANRLGEKRLDGNNGLLLAPHADHVFDRGYMSFSDDGSVLLSGRAQPNQLRLLGIDPATNVGSV